MLVTEDFEVGLEELWGGVEVEVLDLGWGGGGRWDRRGAPSGAPRGWWPAERATTSYLYDFACKRASAKSSFV